MCQAVSEGGRRCPVHQHQNIAAIRAAEHLSGLTRLQTERLFAELRREGRGAEPLSNMLQAGSLRRIRNSVAETPVAEAVAADLTLSREHDPQIDPASAYAQRALRERAVERGQKLKQRFQEVASRTGFSTQEVAAKYAEFRAAVDTSRGSDVPPEYDQNTRRAAVMANLPYDRASVVALEKLNNLVAVETTRRVVHEPATSSSHIQSFGYDSGRLEVVFTNYPNRIYAYRNISQDTWERLSTTNRAGTIFAREIRNNDDCAYASQAEADADAYNVRCAACGQFRAPSHSCPERDLRAELSQTNLTAEQVSSISPDLSHDEPNEESNHSEETPDITLEPTEQLIEEGSCTEEPLPAPASEVPLPAAHLPAQDLTVHAPFPTDLDDTPTGRNVIPIAPRVDVDVFAATAENQRNPAKFDEEVLLVHEQSVQVRNWDAGRIVKGRNIPSGASEIDRAPEHVSFLTKYQNHENVPVKRFDNRVYFARALQDWSGHRSTTTYKVYHAPKSFPTQPLSRNDYISASSAARNELNALVESGEAVVVESTASSTEKYNLDGNRQYNLKIKTAKVAAFRQAIKDNKVAIIPIEVNGVNNPENYVDDQGFMVNGGPRTTVTGQIAVRRNSQGVMEVISTERTLKCECRDYRRNYSCQHVNYIQRHAGNLAQQMTPDPAVRRAGRAARPEGAHRLMSTALLGRSDVQVVEEDGQEPFLRFEFDSGVNARIENGPAYSGNFASRRVIIPARLKAADPEQMTTTEALELAGYNYTVSHMTSIAVPENPAHIRAALKRSDIELPVTGSFTEGSGNNLQFIAVTGNIRFKKTADPADAEIVSHTLRCNCAEYVENSDCKHVRLMKDQHLMLLGVGTRTEASPETALANYMTRHRDIINRERRDGEYMAQYNLTRDQVGSHRTAAAVAEEREREQRARERAERRVIEERERLIVRTRRREEEAARMRAAAETNRRRNRSTITEHDAYRARMLQRWETVDEKYSDNPTAFYEEYKATLARKSAREAPILFRTENVTDGICADEPGARSFGVELEFDIKRGVDKNQALRKIGQELHEAGLTQQAHQTGYHSAARSGWASWSFEQDCTVSGELVSPIMKDTPEHWEQLRKATEIITRNGGIATKRTGSHVHVSTGSYEQSTAKHAELLRTVNNNEDLMYRLASNPKTGKHRGGQWCRPNSDDQGAEFITPEIQEGHRVLGSHQSHGNSLNFEGTANAEYKKSHVEFRMWDGTLDPAVIQQQVMISAALTDHAERSVIANGGSRKPASADRVRKGIGKAKDKLELERAGVRTHTEETFKESSMKAAEFFDKLFRKKEDRAAAASLFAVTNWQE
jgi:hypothetical protein